jgi:hypothetical protein
MADYYIPTRDENEDFNALLNEVPAGELTSELVESLAGKFWGRRLAAGQSLRFTVTDEYGRRVNAEVRPPEPAAEPVQTPAEPETPEPLVPFSDLPANIGDRYRRMLAAIEGHPWGAPRSGGYTPDGDVGGVTYDGAGRILQGGPQTLTDDDAKAAHDALAAAPKYGQPGWQGGKQQALDALGKARGQRTQQLTPERQARLAQAEAELAVEARAGFMVEVREREAAGKPITNYRELATLAEKHGHRL